MICFHDVLNICRVSRLVFDLVLYWGYLRLRPTVPGTATKSDLTTRNASLVCTTLGEEDRFIENIRSWLLCSPGEIIIVTIDRRLQHLQNLLGKLGDDRIKLCSVEKPDPRLQFSKGFAMVQTDFIVVIDDDTRWSRGTLARCIGAFACPEIGGVNTMQEVIPLEQDGRYTTWESWGALNLVRRNILHSAMAFYRDGQVLNLSGRTAAYRTEILQNKNFLKAFVNDTWRNNYRLRTGEDNFFTRWTLHHGWNTSFQNQLDAMIYTTANADASYLKQVLRWSRDTARHYIRDGLYSFRVGRREDRMRCVSNVVANYASDVHVIVEMCYLTVQSLHWTWTYFLVKQKISLVQGSSNQQDQRLLSSVYAEHFLWAAILTIFEHAPFFRSVNRLRYVPGTIVYMYVHAIIVLYALLTLHKSVWGSRPGAD